MIKKNIVITILSLFLITALEATAQHAHLKVYPKASQIQWTGYGAIGNYSLSGTLDITEGIFEVDSLQQLVNGVLVLNMKRIDHDNNTLVKHLKSEDFFAVA
ncbi:MAG: YceI family protein, partial [Bacteroidota bacterium]